MDEKFVRVESFDGQSTMKGWLNKPPVVVSLAVIAMGIIYFNVVRPMLGSSQLPAMDVSLQDAGMMLSEQPGLGHATSLAQGRGADWKRLSMLSAYPSGRLDPFRPYMPSNVIVPIDESHLSGRMSTLKSIPAVVIPEFAPVRAIAFSSSLRYAVIGNKIVQEGDHINGYSVVKIRKNTVVLQGSAGVVTLRFDKQRGEG